MTEKKNVNDFKSGIYAIRVFILLMIPDLIKIIIKLDPKTIYGNEKDFLNLLTSLVLIPMFFNYKKLNVEIYTLIYKLISPIVESPDKYSDQLKTGILGCKIFDLILKIPKYDGAKGSEHSPIETSLLIEILLLVKSLQVSAPQCQCIFEFPMGLLKLDRYKTIIGEKFDFDMISYMNFYENLAKNAEDAKIDNNANKVNFDKKSKNK